MSPHSNAFNDSSDGPSCWPPNGSPLLAPQIAQEQAPKVALLRITFNVGYHVEHHGFMNIPGSRLPELHRRPASIYRPMASHSSWTALLIEFIWRTDVGVQSRIVR